MNFNIGDTIRVWSLDRHYIYMILIDEELNNQHTFASSVCVFLYYPKDRYLSNTLFLENMITSNVSRTKMLLTERFFKEIKERVIGKNRTNHGDYF